MKVQAAVTAGMAAREKVLGKPADLKLEQCRAALKRKPPPPKPKPKQARQAAPITDEELAAQASEREIAAALAATAAANSNAERAIKALNKLGPRPCISAHLGLPLGHPIDWSAAEAKEALVWWRKTGERLHDKWEAATINASKLIDAARDEHAEAAKAAEELMAEQVVATTVKLAVARESRANVAGAEAAALRAAEASARAAAEAAATAAVESDEEESDGEDEWEWSESCSTYEIRSELELMMCGVALADAGFTSCAHCGYLLVRDAQELATEMPEAAEPEPLDWRADGFVDTWSASRLLFDTIITPDSWVIAVATTPRCAACTAGGSRGSALTDEGEEATQSAVARWVQLKSIVLLQRRRWPKLARAQCQRVRGGGIS